MFLTRLAVRAAINVRGTKNHESIPSDLGRLLALGLATLVPNRATAADEAMGLALRRPDPERLDQGGERGQQVGGQGRRHRRHRQGVDALQPQDATRTSSSGPSSRSTTTATRACTSARPTPNGSFSEGYEAQVDSTHRDPIRTGSLYTFIHIFEQLVPPDTWFTYEIEVRDQGLPRAA